MKYIFFFLIGLIICSITYSQKAQSIKDTSVGFAFSKARFGEGDFNGYLLSSSVFRKMKSGTILCGINHSYGFRQRNNFFHVPIDNNVYHDFEDRFSSMYLNCHYLITPIETECLSFSLGVGAIGGYVSSKYWANWLKENDVDPYVIIMGDYNAKYSVGLSFKALIDLDIKKSFEILFTTGYDSFIKGQSIYFIGTGFKF